MSGETTLDAAGEEAAGALAAARAFYGSETLRLPPLPRALAGRLVQIDEAEWGVAPEDDDGEPLDGIDLNDRAGFLDRALDPATPDDVAFGYAGHGSSSWFMCYQLIQPGLALFIRQGYGGPYRAPEPAQKVLNAAYHDALALVVYAAAAAGTGKLAQGQRLIVVLDDRAPSIWGLSDAPDGWQESSDPIGSGQAFLQG